MVPARHPDRRSNSRSGSTLEPARASTVGHRPGALDSSTPATTYGPPREQHGHNPTCAREYHSYLPEGQRT